MTCPELFSLYAQPQVPAPSLIYLPFLLLLAFFRDAATSEWTRFRFICWCGCGTSLGSLNCRNEGTRKSSMPCAKKGKRRGKEDPKRAILAVIWGNGKKVCAIPLWGNVCNVLLAPKSWQGKSFIIGFIPMQQMLLHVVLNVGCPQ